MHHMFYSLASSAVGRFAGFSGVSTVPDLESTEYCHPCVTHLPHCSTLLYLAAIFLIRRWYSSRSFSESLLLTDGERDLRDLAKKCGLDANTVDKAMQDIQDIQDIYV